MKGFREQGVLVKPARRDNKRLAMLTHLLCTRHNFSSDVRHTPLLFRLSPPTSPAHAPVRDGKHFQVKELAVLISTSVDTFPTTLE